MKEAQVNPGGGPVDQRRKRDGEGGSQRQRLLVAITQLVAHEGYERTKIADIATAAGVSRPTFYEHFADKQECFLVAYGQSAERLSGEVTEAVSTGDPAAALESALGAVVRFAERESDAFRFVGHEAMHAGRQAMQRRDELIAELEETVHQTWSRVPDAALSAIPAGLLLRATMLLVGIESRRGEDRPTRLLGDLLEWVACYRVDPGARRWRHILPDEGLVRATEGLELPPISPLPLPRGRHQIPQGVVKRVQRERILYATAEVVRAKGFASTNVADVVAEAGVTRKAFYAHFPNMRSAFEATRGLVFERMMGLSSGIFFTSTSDWPERVWETGYTFSKLLAASPSFAFVGFVETYATDASGEQSDNLFLAFVTFLQEGYRYRPEGARLPAIIALAVLCGDAEAISFYLRHFPPSQLPGFIPLGMFMTLAPFIGTTAAGALIERKVRELEVPSENSSAKPQE